MNHKELQAIRKLLMLDASEAAEEIGKVSVRSWQYWESGERAVPQDVADEMEALRDLRVQEMDKIDARLSRGEQVALPFHQRYEDYAAQAPNATLVAWRLSQSLAALYYTEGLASLI